MLYLKMTPSKIYLNGNLIKDERIAAPTVLTTKCVSMGVFGVINDFE